MHAKGQLSLHPIYVGFGSISARKADHFEVVLHPGPGMNEKHMR